MDIIKAFQNDTHITIKGSSEEPLFRASDIGLILGFNDINNTIKNFNNKEKVRLRTLTLGGPQDVNFLTEKGLYKLLFKSKKEIASQFQDWVCDIIKEIRLTGKYELEQQILEQQKQLEDKNQELFSAKETALLETHKNSRGIYLAFTDKNKTEVKFGHGEVEKRVKMHKKEIGNEFNLQYVVETIYDRELETLIKSKLKDRIISKKFEGRKAKCVEIIKIDSDYTIEKLYRDVLQLKKKMKDEIIINLKQTVKDLKFKLKKYEKDSENEDSENDDFGEMNNEDSDEDSDEDILKNTETQIEIPNKPKKKMPLQLIMKLKKKVYKFSIRENPPCLVAEFDSINKAAEEQRIAPTSLSQRIRMGTNINGFIWSFDEKIPKNFFSTKNTLVYKFDSNLVLLETFSSINEAARIENIEAHKLQRLTRTNTKIGDFVYSRTIYPDKIKIPTPVNGKEVNKIDNATGKILQTFKSGTEAGLDAGVNQSAISRRIKNKSIVNGILYTHS